MQRPMVAEGRERIGLGGAVASWGSRSGGHKSCLEPKQAPLPGAELGKPGSLEGVTSHLTEHGGVVLTLQRRAVLAVLTVELAFIP